MSGPPRRHPRTRGLPRRDRAPRSALAARARSIRRGGRESRARALRALLPDPGELVERLRVVHGGEGCARTGAWTSWERDIAHREPDAIARWTERCAREIRLHKLTQFLFFEHWQRIRDACHARSIQIMGDLPIFVAHDSADVWAARNCFVSIADGKPDGRRRRAARLLQRHRPAVGQSALPLGRTRTGRIRVVDRTLPRAADAGRSRSGSITSADSTRRGRCPRDHDDRCQWRVGARDQAQRSSRPCDPR